MTLAVAAKDAVADALPPGSTDGSGPPPAPPPPWRADELARAAGVAAAVALGAVVAATGGVPLRAHPPAVPRSAPFDYPWVDTAAAARSTAAPTTAADAARRWSAWAFYATHQACHWALIWVTTSRGGGTGCGRRPRGAGARVRGGPSTPDHGGGRHLCDDGGCPKVGPAAAVPCAASAKGAAAVTPAVPSDAHRLRWWHVATLGLHGVFGAARVAHTRWISYDGLARDVHEATALGAVAVLLVWVWLLRAPERGVFGGARLWLPGGPAAAATVWRAAVGAHSYAFSAACLWTLWYHPAVATPAHVTGFVYIAALLVQSGLAGTAAHVGEHWMTMLEVGVAGHALVTAAAATGHSTTTTAAAAAAGAARSGSGGGRGRSLLPLFGWGFATTFIAVPLHGVGWSATTCAWVTASYGAVATAAVAGGWGGTRGYHVVAILVADLFVLGVLIALLGAGGWLARRLRAWRRRQRRRYVAVSGGEAVSVRPVHSMCAVVA